ncbi:hypothetical protein AK812_SmicGene27046 [Symbiodinium microadriaticum]|uniref:Ubiquitin-like domain-containing protein n=1 Tax=Symbiodinium microadriaticum TaxID=2951 RepID=A0A1Q9D7Z6_SYMMI|nr:hypothetical protein AK812_SmicGene27046 [Symbiodinium microadriaticum]
MSIEVAVGLLSGKTAVVKADMDEKVGALNSRAQTALGVGRGRLVGSSGTVLHANAPIWSAGLSDGDVLTLQINGVQVQAADKVFAAILGDATVAIRGDSQDKDGRKNVQQIQASHRAFAAILGDGSVVTWSSDLYGGDSSAVQAQLKNVQQTQACGDAFAAILADGTVVTWGYAESGGDSGAVQHQLKTVQQIQASEGAIAAILADGSVVTWGGANYGGDSGAVQHQLKNVQQIQADYQGANKSVSAPIRNTLKTKAHDYFQSLHFNAWAKLKASHIEQDAWQRLPVARSSLAAPRQRRGNGYAIF